MLIWKISCIFAQNIINKQKKELYDLQISKNS